MIIAIYCIIAYMLGVIYVRFDTNTVLDEDSWHAYHAAILWFAPVALPATIFIGVALWAGEFIFAVPRWIVQAGRPPDYYTHLLLKDLARHREKKKEPPQ